ncbi:MAG: hypothetical protein AAF417_11580 [Pseudomonadota bacterium]
MDDEVLPRLTLAVDGLTDTSRFTPKDLELESEAAATAAEQETPVPDQVLDPEQLEVYGWESSFWRKVLSYFRF